MQIHHRQQRIKNRVTGQDGVVLAAFGSVVSALHIVSRYNKNGGTIDALIGHFSINDGGEAGNFLQGWPFLVICT